MSNRRRTLLKSAIAFLDRASAIVERALGEEQDALDNIPENLQMSERYEGSEAAVDCLEEAASAIDEAMDKIAAASA